MCLIAAVLLTCRVARIVEIDDAAAQGPLYTKAQYAAYNKGTRKAASAWTGHSTHAGAHGARGAEVAK